MPVRPEYVLAATEDSPFYGTRRSFAQLFSHMDEDSFQTEQLPPGWLLRRWDGWEGWTPRDWRPRVQGWKIHVSTIPDQARETLSIVTRICVARSVAFKFLPLLSNLVDSNGKQHNRGGSGKFITIYPQDDEQFAQLLDELEPALAGRHGPYILSDLRYGDAPVYVRYGGITQVTYPDEQDRPVAAIASPVDLALIPDERKPRFFVPDGVELPACLAASWARAQTSEPSRLREFKAISPMHFSNAGGVYKATLPDGTVRTLREARSHTGLDGRHRDAVTRQKEEQTVLADLAGLSGVQQLVGHFWSWEHRYLELEYASGVPLNSWVVRNTPFDGDPDAVAAFAARSVTVGREIIRIVESIHARGWTLGDLHPGNILVDENDHVTIIDFEDATRIDEPREIGFRVFEYCAPRALDAVEADWYAIARCLMVVFVPEWEKEIIAPDMWQASINKVATVFGPDALALINDVTARYPEVPAHMLAPDLTVKLWKGSRDTAALIEALDAGIEWSRQFSPQGSFPGDPTRPMDASETFGFGRAGVVHARLSMGRPVAESDVDALVAACQAPGIESGLYAGRAGIALVLAEAQRYEEAIAAVMSALDEVESRKRLDLYGGHAGVVLAALEIARITEDADLRDRALQANEWLQRTVVPDTTPWTTLTHRRGLHFGLTGLALVDLVAYLTTGQVHQLDRASERLRCEFDACMFTASGDLMVRDVDANRALPYLEWGSAGIWGVALAAERLLGHRLLTDKEYAGAVAACSSDIYVYGTLDHGRTGIMAVLACAGPTHADEVARQREYVIDELLSYDDAALVVGDGLIRLSADLSTGAAGVAIGLHAASGVDPFAWLPVSSMTTRTLSARPHVSGPAWAPLIPPSHTVTPELSLVH